MTKKLTTSILFATLFFTLPTLFAQELLPQTKKEVIAKAISDYFFLERENIHVQLNKKTYLTNEQIWFKGYIFHRKKNVPFFTTVNVYVNLLDDTGKVIDTQLLYGNIGSFSGKFNLNKNFKSGKYYLQFYTNWMNNFTEDESAVYEISVINQATGAGKALAKADPSKLNINLNPEGGAIIDGVTNIIGIAVSDCNNNPVNVSTVDVIDGAGKVQLKVQLNKMGYGRFNLSPKSNGYKVVAIYNDVVHEQTLPAAQVKGIAIEANTNTVAEKTLITIRTNKVTQGYYNDKPLYLVIHKDDEAIIYDVDFKNATEIKLVVPNTDLSDGMNTLRIIDADYNQISERLIYNYPKSTLHTDVKLDTYTTVSNHLAGSTHYPNMNLSISILPKNSIAVDETNDIYSSLLLLPYIQGQKKASGKYYFGSLTKIKAYELDLFLLNQKSKYNWNTIKTTAPKDNYPFDRGLTLKGFVPKSAGQILNTKVRMYSLTSGIDITVPVADDGSFVYDNLVMADSAYVNFTVLNKSVKPKEIFVVPQILNGSRKINKSYKPQPLCVGIDDKAVEETITHADMPVFPAESIMLEETIIEKKRLRYEKSFGNANLTGYKITNEDANYNHNVLQYLIRHGGFTVNQNNMGMDVHLYSRGRSSINAGQTEPIIYIDNMQVLDHNQLTLIQMSEVDEVYINPTAIVPSIRNFNGIIKIYLKQAGSYAGGKKNTTPDIIVKKAFSKIVPFANINYATTGSKGFENFGVIDWEPLLTTDDTGAFKFTIPRTEQKTLQFLIEGFSADGKILSEIKTITVY
jgi:hypothetical protein